MNMIGTKGIDNKSMQPYVWSAMMAIIIMRNLYKKGRSLSLKNTLGICSSFMAVISFSAKLHENYVSDKVFVYFSPEDIKSVVTLFSPEISAIEAHPMPSNTYSNAPTGYSHVMLIELTKQIVAPGNPKKALRHIKLQHYHYQHEDNPYRNLTPQLVLKISGKRVSNTTEVSFSHSRPMKKFVLDVRGKKYTRYTPVSDANFIEKALTMHMEKRTLLSILLEKYTAQEKSYANAEKAIYLLSNFSHLLHKSVLIALKQKIRKSLCSDMKLLHDTRDLQSLLKYLDNANVPLQPFTLREAEHNSLKSDIASLLRQRASNYHALHEILKQNGGSKRLAIQSEEIIACYTADNTLSKTSTLLKRFILADNTLSARLKAIHGYIDAHKSCSQTNLECTILDDKFQEDSPENMYAHGALLECARESAQYDPATDYSIASIIECARKKVSQKYYLKLSDSATTLIDKACVRAEHLEIKIEKSKTLSYITEIEDISSPFSEYVHR